MKKIRIGREKISIPVIGRKRFWSGIIIGVFVAIILSIFFNHSRETLRFFTSFNVDLYIPDSNEFFIYNLFFSSIASTIGFGITLWVWLNKRSKNNLKKQRYSRFAQLNILLITWVTLMAIARMGTILTFVVYGFAGYDNYLNFALDFKLLLVLVPVIIFLQSWYMVRLVYKSTKWIIYSLGIIVLFTIVLLFATRIDPEKINKPYHELFKTEYEFIESQIKLSKEQYHIQFDKTTIDLLKKRYTISSVNFVEKIKKEFGKNKKIELKNIILEKICIHNLKRGKHLFGSNRNDWSYCHPKEIFNQIIKFDINDSETKELFLVLKEQIDLWNSPKLDWNKYNDYSNLERERARYANYRYPQVIKEQLLEVRKDLILDEKYKRYHSLLPVIKSRE